MIYLKDNIFKSLNQNNEPFAVIDNRLYTFSIEDSTLKDNYLFFNNLRKKIEESEKISNLERKLFEKNKDSIEKDLIDYLRQEINYSYNELLNLKRIVDSSSDDIFIREFMINHLFRNYYTDNPEYFNSLDLDIKRIEDKQLFNYDLSYLKLDTSFFNRKYGDGIVVINSKCYPIKAKGFPKDITSFDRMYILLNRKKYSLSKPFLFNNMINDYNDCLKNYLINIFRENSPNAKKFLSKLTENRQKLMDIKKQNEGGRLSVGSISYEKIDINKYRIYRKMSSFIFGYNHNYYLYPDAELFINFTKKKNSIVFENNPSILDRYLPYNHPFVFSHGKICLSSNPQNSLENVGFIIDKDYSLSNLDDLANIILNSFIKTAGVLEYGYTIPSIIPADYSWESKAKLIANNKNDALSYAKYNNLRGRFFDQKVRSNSNV